ncbi:iron ABC transporter permease [Actinoplanes sp. TBRC 11911]|uniref:ABC transporter permease n=1 Tax=Actinoplanes sp. TBRC 11911 TaxID=2729386 RepID=UPI00145E99E9|nr:iron ABC transporter permease [Actinoplanes sp. TBRC 11911]NMO56904.1 iron ABC transporter permease [Actinoplanes sp. TBRC 11911]
MISRVAAAGTVRYPPLRLALAAVVGLLSLVPLGYVVASVASAGSGIGDLLWRPRVGVLLVHTVLVVGLGSAGSVLVGGAAAYLVERTGLPGRRVWTAVLAAPLAVPAFVISFGWSSWQPGFAGLLPCVLVSTLAYYPLVFLPVAAALRGLDPAVEEAARALGDGPVRTFFRTVVPRLRPAAIGGALLVALHLLAEFGAIQQLRYDTFTTAIYDQYQSTFDGSGASALAGVLVLLCLLVLGGEAGLAGRRRTARIGGGAARVKTARTNRFRYAAPLPLTVIVVASLGVPAGVVVWWLVTSTSTAFPAALLARTAGSTVLLSAAGAAITTALALPVAWLVERRRGLAPKLIERAGYVGNSLPGIVVALALITIAIRYVPSLYQSTAMLLAAYSVLFLPLAVVSLRASLRHIPPELDDVARSLGLRPAGVLWRVTVPLVARGAGAGAALVFLAVMTELTATLLLAPIGTNTLATQFWSYSSELHYGAAAPFALLMIVLAAPATLLLTRRA